MRKLAQNLTPLVREAFVAYNVVGDVAGSR